jgi:hypothetical protein
MPDHIPTSAEPRGSIEVYLEVSGQWALSHLTRDWSHAQRHALLAGDLDARQHLLDAAERATLAEPDRVLRTVQTLTIHADREQGAQLAEETGGFDGAAAIIGLRAEPAPTPIGLGNPTDPQPRPGGHDRPPRVEISARQLGGLRDGHLVRLRADDGRGCEVALGDLTELQIEALAAGQPTDAVLELDGEGTLVGLVPRTPDQRD